MRCRVGVVGFDGDGGGQSSPTGQQLVKGGSKAGIQSSRVLQALRVCGVWCMCVRADQPSSPGRANSPNSSQLMMPEQAMVELKLQKATRC